MPALVPHARPQSIHNARILRPDATGYLDADSIHVDADGRIAEIGTSVTTTEDSLDARGATVLPGLIDCHAHSIIGLEHEHHMPADRRIGDQYARAVVSLARAVWHGITTVRDAGSPTHAVFSIRDAIDSFALRGPRLLLTGNALCIRHGHGWDSICVEADTPDEIREAARRQLDAGATWLKLMASGGAGTRGETMTGPQYDREQMGVAVAEARPRGAGTMAHATTADAVREALAAGVDSMEHGLFLDEDAITRMRAADAYYTPTIAVYRRIANNAAPGRYPEFMQAKARDSLSAHRHSFQMAMDAGIKMVAGSDCGNHGYFMGDLADELVLMHEYGLPAPVCLQAATSRAAELVGLSDQIGSVEVGKVADLLVVEGDPLADLNALYDVRAVYVRGRRMR